jgi:hypothetical protein
VGRSGWKQTAVSGHYIVFSCKFKLFFQMRHILPVTGNCLYGSQPSGGNFSLAASRRLPRHCLNGIFRRLKHFPYSFQPEENRHAAFCQIANRCPVHLQTAVVSY